MTLALFALLVRPSLAVCPPVQATLDCASVVTGHLDPGPWVGADPAGPFTCAVGFEELDSALGAVGCEPWPACGAGWACYAPVYDCGQPLSGTIQEGPEHVYAFTCATSGEVEIRLSGLDCDLDLFVLDATCAETGGCEAGRTAAFVAQESLVFDCVAGNTYHVVVEGFGFTYDAWSAYVHAQPGPGYCYPEDRPAHLGSYTLEFVPGDPATSGCPADPPPVCDADGDGSDAEACGGADCDDGAASTRPGAAELPDGRDNDCDGVVDEGTPRFDDDGDGSTELGGDCDDADPGVFPGAFETCDGVDEDCDGLVDQGTPCADDDGDGFCEVGPCVEGLPGDCHDGDPGVNPGVSEVAGNGVDDDCDGAVDGADPDPDGDGFTAFGGDCAPMDPVIHPAAVELPNGLDDDCDGAVDEGMPFTDDDEDGATELGGDCHDGDPDIGPAAEEVENGIDDDCDGEIDEGTPSGDDDGDGFTEAGGDCDDADDDVTPGATELPNGVDDDCDGAIDEGLVDRDGDGVSVEDGDCDDLDGFAHPGMDELCDAVDNDCDDEVDEGCDEEPAPAPAPEPETCGCRSAPATGAFGLMALVARRRRR